MRTFTIIIFTLVSSLTYSQLKDIFTLDQSTQATMSERVIVFENNTGLKYSDLEMKFLRDHNSFIASSKSLLSKVDLNQPLTLDGKTYDVSQTKLIQITTKESASYTKNVSDTLEITAPLNTSYTEYALYLADIGRASAKKLILIATLNKPISFNDCKIMLQKSNSDKALDCYNRVLALTGRHTLDTELLIKIGLYLISLGHCDEANTYITIAANTHPLLTRRFNAKAALNQCLYPDRNTFSPYLYLITIPLALPIVYLLWNLRRGKQLLTPSTSPAPLSQQPLMSLPQAASAA